MSVNFNKLQKRIRRLTASAIQTYHMIEEGDKIMVCLSGGKDSYALLDMLMRLQKTAPIRFELLAVNLDQKQPGFDATILPNYFEKIGVDYLIINEDTYSIVTDKIESGKTMCSLCSRLRRGILYRVARENGCHKIALGHHKDDILETFFLNIFFTGSLKTMPPKLRSDDGQNVVIRPLAFVDEADLEKYATHMQFPILPCNLCGSQDNLQRKIIKEMLATWQRDFPHRKSSLFKALMNVSPSHLLDARLFDFASLLAGQTQAGDAGWLIPKPQLLLDDALDEIGEADLDSDMTYTVPHQRLERPIIFQPLKENK